MYVHLAECAHCNAAGQELRSRGRYNSEMTTARMLLRAMMLCMLNNLRIYDVP